MSVLLIGGDSYLGRSIAEDCKNSGVHLISFSKRKTFSDFSYHELEDMQLSGFDYAIIIGTSGHFTLENEPRFEKWILEIFEKNKLPSFGISTIRVLDFKLNPENAYIRQNLNFEDQLLNFKSPRILRIPNFLGIVPSRNENQAKLLPWSILDETITTGGARIQSSLNSSFEWVCAADIRSAISIIRKSRSKERVFELQKGFYNRMGDIVAQVQDLSLNLLQKTAIFQEIGNSNTRFLMHGTNPMSEYSWESKLQPADFEHKYELFFNNNWGKNV